MSTKDSRFGSGSRDPHAPSHNSHTGRIPASHTGQRPHARSAQHPDSLRNGQNPGQTGSLPHGQRRPSRPQSKKSVVPYKPGRRPGGGGRNVSRRSFSGALLGVVGGLSVMAIGGGYAYAHRSVVCTINGAQAKAAARSSVQDLIDAGLIKPQYGDLMSVSGKVLKKGEGNRYTMSVNGVDLGDKIDDWRLSKDDVIVFTDGTPAVEEHDSEKTPVPFEIVRSASAGAVSYVAQWGEDGYKEVVKGKVSGETVDKGLAKPPKNHVVHYLNIEPRNKEKLVAITFDDGPTNTDIELIDVLKQYNAKATFFHIGNNTSRYHEFQRRVIEAGHQVGCHTLSHPQLTKQTPERVVSELVDCYKVFKDTNDLTTRIFRAPYGAFAMREFEIARDLVSAVIGWNHDTLDWRHDSSTESIIKGATNSMRPGDIILCHSGPVKRDKTLHACAPILEAWTKAGYRFVTMAELMASDPRIPAEVANDKVTAPQGQRFGDVTLPDQATLAARKYTRVHITINEDGSITEGKAKTAPAGGKKTPTGSDKKTAQAADAAGNAGGDTAAGNAGGAAAAQAQEKKAPVPGEQSTSL